MGGGLEYRNVVAAVAIAWGLFDNCEYDVEKADGCEDEAGKEV